MSHIIHEIPWGLQIIFVIIAVFLMSLVLTPLMIFVSKKIGAVDKPNKRRINTKIMPSAGGLVIFLVFAFTVLLILPNLEQSHLLNNASRHFPPHSENYFTYIMPFVLAGLVVVVTGLIDDIISLSPRLKMMGLILASVLVWFFTHARFDNLKIPFGGPLLIFPTWLSFIVTIFWIVSITNALNLIDGLDGLATGVSMISLATMGIVANYILPNPNNFLPATILVLFVACAGFLPYNFYPAKIYLGDTGALFLGFMIAVFSLQGLKNATAVAVVTPLLILGVPLVDTLGAIIRRRLNKQKISSADRMHLHHRLLAMGFTHRGAVLTIWGIAGIFAGITLILQVSSRIGGIILLIGILLGLGIFVERVGILGKNRQPIMNTLRFIGSSDYRDQVLEKRRNKSSK
ncbi:MAG: undecaprenyl/decaprenyl-phosphate alpha-N-acetylglucosaminyl 1-phosphate transferase [Streptococcaceae bacterium]|nr:undecaprenyl/decaprenyl-phosphate alpha-N-acetylglucosaminyl 1-phosphate transferase [Streptococcaceae bacterium]MCL2858513.1 undecaprenyl/decaprenyl-phosphate alpha-N-acetylglucosaminyl 1-phosphate transferase [Streptococcaceae bacterium]